MAIREDKLGQSWLFSPCITDFIPKNHICNLIIAIIAEIDIDKVEKKIQIKTRQSCISKADAIENISAGCH